MLCVSSCERCRGRAAPEVRFRFTSPHPKDFPDGLLQLIAERSNIAKWVHLPAQSGSTAVLEVRHMAFTLVRPGGGKP